MMVKLDALLVIIQKYTQPLIIIQVLSFTGDHAIVFYLEFKFSYNV